MPQRAEGKDGSGEEDVETVVRCEENRAILSWLRDTGFSHILPREKNRRKVTVGWQAIPIAS